MVFVHDIKKILLRKLKNNHVFWSYNHATVSLKNIPDEILITKTLTYRPQGY